MPLIFPEQFRKRMGALASTSGGDGAFILRHPTTRAELVIIASSGYGWEHVSVSTYTRIPTWDEMHYVRGVFWHPEDCVMQLHPPASQYVNCHPNCLHLWRPTHCEIPQPPSWMVGPNGS